MTIGTALSDVRVGTAATDPAKRPTDRRVSFMLMIRWGIKLLNVCEDRQMLRGWRVRKQTRSSHTYTRVMPRRRIIEESKLRNYNSPLKLRKKRRRSDRHLLHGGQFDGRPPKHGIDQA